MGEEEGWEKRKGMKVREWQREVIKSGSGGRKRIDAVKMLSFFPSLEDYVTWLMEGLRWVGWIITIMPSFIFIMQKIYLGVFAHWIKSILRKKNHPIQSL